MSGLTWDGETVIKRFVAHHAEFPLRLVSARENLSDIRRDHGKESGSLAIQVHKNKLQNSQETSGRDMIVDTNQKSSKAGLIVATNSP